MQGQDDRAPESHRNGKIGSMEHAGPVDVTSDPPGDFDVGAPFKGSSPSPLHPDRRARIGEQGRQQRLSFYGGQDEPLKGWRGLSQESRQKALDVGTDPVISDLSGVKDDPSHRIGS